MSRSVQSRNAPARPRFSIAAGCAVAIALSAPLVPRSVYAVGATLPFTSYEAEAGTLGGGATAVSLGAAPTNTQFSSPALEASGHAYAQLTGTGQYVQWTNNTGQPITFINVRESIPDAPNGGGITATLNLYVNGVFRQTLNVNSKQTWIYEGNNNYQGNDQNPADGDPHVFWDESHTFITGAPIAPGSTFALQKDAANTAAFYDIDVVDVENPPAPIAQPANSISITSCGAVADSNPTNGAANPGAVDSTAAIQNCINQAQSQGKTLYIPQGTFYLNGTQGLQAQGITIQGAGMWYSTIYRNVPLPNNVGLAAVFSVTSCQVRNLHVDSNALSRGTNDGDGGAMDTTGTNWLADGVWNQHTESGFWASGTGGTVQNSRLTALWADGININNVSLNNTVGNNITVNNNFVRGTGDDAIAINSVNYNTTSTGNVFYTPMANATVTNNTSVAPWQGKGLAIYGGSGHTVANNLVADTGRYLGLGIGRFGVNGNDLLSATVTGNVILRSGGNGFNQGQPSMQIGNGGDGQSVGTVTNVTVSGNTIIDSLYDSIGFSTATNITVEDNTIIYPGRNGIVISPPFYPAPTGSATLTANSVIGVPSGDTAFANDSSGFSATLNGNSWQLSTPETPFKGAVTSIPGTLQAANYDVGGQAIGYNVLSVNGTDASYRTDAVDLETTADTGGGDDLGWTSSGQWFRYTVNVASPGRYTVSFRVAAPSAVTDAFHLSNSTGVNLSGPVSIPTTGGWQTWTTVTATVTLAAGQQVLTLSEDNSGWNITHATFVAAPGQPFGSSPAAIPGTVQAENYDLGGAGVAYNVNLINGTAPSYRADEVDLETSADAGGGYDLGWTSGGQWFRYTVNVAAAGNYTVSFRVAAPSAVEDAFHLSSASGADLSGPINIATTGDWQNWTTVTATVSLAAGEQVLILDEDNGGWNINYASFASASGTAGSSAASGSTSGSASAANPVRIPTVRPRLGRSD